MRCVSVPGCAACAVSCCVQVNARCIESATHPPRNQVNGGFHVGVNINIEHNGGFFDASPKNDRVSLNVKTPNALRNDPARGLADVGPQPVTHPVWNAPQTEGFHRNPAPSTEAARIGAHLLFTVAAN